MSIESLYELHARLCQLSPDRQLTLSQSFETERNATHYHTQWLLEHNQQQQLIARFKTWINTSLAPPYRRQAGWERYSPDGTLLEREVHYSKGQNKPTVH